MLTAARVFFVLGIVLGLGALVARFALGAPLLGVHPGTWLEATGVMMHVSVASALLGIAELLAKKSA